MCGRYTITVSLEELMAYYMITESSASYHRPRFNIAPGQMVLAVVSDGERNRLGELKWGLIPPWAKDERIGSKMINARSETVDSKPAFRKSLRKKRCLIPADGFYEWKRQESSKQPMRVVMKDRSLFSMAGLYETWIRPDGAKVSSCTILTTEPNELMAPIHDRMPVILSREDEALWLDRQTDDPEPLLQLLRPYPAGKLEAYPVGPAVGNVKNDSPSLIEAFAKGQPQ
jgi:putative SOS response-associated peptidase YedK